MGLRALAFDLEPERRFDQRIDVGTREIEIGEDVATMQTGRRDARGGVVDPGEDLTARSSRVVVTDDRLHHPVAPQATIEQSVCRSTAFCRWSRFSAWSKMIERGPSAT